MPPEIINEVNTENYQYSVWERAEKNRILNLGCDTSKKTALWQSKFPRFISDDSWMETATVW